MPPTSGDYYLNKLPETVPHFSYSILLKKTVLKQNILKCPIISNYLPLKAGLVLQFHKLDPL